MSKQAQNKNLRNLRNLWIFEFEMVVRLENVVPWGRSLDEYWHMFDLDEDLLSGRILGCADGPASFNAEMTALGRSVVSCDPLYQFPASGIRDRVEATYPLILEQVRQSQDDYVWDVIPSPEALGEMRLAAMERFLDDFEDGLANGRYLPNSLPTLPFDSDALDLALCSHFLFLYSEQLDTDFHITAVLELLRVAKEVRIFPLLDLNCELSAHVQPVCDRLVVLGHEMRITAVPYEFQRGGNKMMRIVRN